jgi:hypothetical protein
MAPTSDNIVVGLQTNNTVKVGVYGTVEGSCTELGLTEGGVEITGAREYYERMADQYIGVLGVDKTKERLTVKFSVAEATLDNLRLALDYPAAALVASVLTGGGNPTATYLTLFVNVKSVGGNNRKYEFIKVINISGAGHAYKKNEKTLIEFEFLVIQDTAKAANQQMFIVTDSGVDTTAPAVALSTPVDGGTVVKVTKGTVVWTITEAGAMDVNSIEYGNTVLILNTTVHATAVLVAGSIAYDATAKTITFTPTANWTASDTLQAQITTGLCDMAGNHLAATKIEQFQVTA